MGRHAYLIIAHHQFELLKKLIMLLDDKRNDIYIHVDKNAKNFDKDLLYQAAEFSKIYFVKRVKIAWGGYSQIKCELELLKSAVKGNYQYYHLISGVDLPIKTNDEIHAFFDENNGSEFIHFDSEEVDKSVFDRLNIYHFLQEHRKNRILNKLEDKFLYIQRRLKINRLKKEDLLIQKGANWFSITDKLAKYVVSRERQIQSLFRYSICCDEVFLQTLIVNSDYEQNLYIKEKNDNYIGCMRYIDWKRGNPYVFKKDDYDKLIDSPYLFARKFDLDIDSDIVQKIFNTLLKYKRNGSNVDASKLKI